MHKKKPVLTTERLLLHSYRDTDLEPMVSLLRNEEIRKNFVIPDLPTMEDAVKMFDKLKAFSISDDHFEYGVTLNGELIGFVNDVTIDGETIELGYVIRPDMKNRGYASEALSAAINELFRMGYATARCGFFEDNIASRRVMEKCGMHSVDKTEVVAHQGISRRCLYYEIERP